MTDTPTESPSHLPEAHPQRSRWIGLVWAVPIAALMIVTFLGVRSLADRGIDVVVTFETGAGARVGDTKVIYQGVEAGSVSKIQVNEDGHRIDLTLTVDRRAEAGLTSTTIFWLNGAKPSLNDLSSVKSALTGLSIGVARGNGGTPTRRFVGLTEPPIVMPGTAGTAFVLTSAELASAQIGSPIFFHGQLIGKVTSIDFPGPQRFRLGAFISAPFDKLVQPHSIFWVSSPIQFALTDKGASVNLEHGSALLSGAIEFDGPPPGQASEQSSTGSEFVLNLSREEARAGPSGPEVLYTVVFNDPAAGDLVVGAPVRLLGFRIGEVKSVTLMPDSVAGRPSATVVAAIFPRRLLALPAADTASSPDASDLRRQADATISRLLALGHRARLVQRPALIGARIVTFDPVAGARPATLGLGDIRSIPSADVTDGIEQLTGKASQILAKVDRLPIEAIGENLRSITERVNRLVSSPELASSLKHLDGTLAETDAMMKQVRPQIEPLLAKLGQAVEEANSTIVAAHGMLDGSAADASGGANLKDAIRELTATVRSIRTLVETLERHPESLLRGRGARQAKDQP